MIQHLNIYDVLNVFVWLKEHDFDFDAGRLHRDFSDAVHVAEILKSIYPRLVEMNNYPKCNRTDLKIKNWETLNFKVLKKIDLHLKQKRIVKLAKGKPGAIELLLYQIMMKEIECRRENDTTINLQEQIWTENDDVVTVNMKKMVNGEIVEAPEKLILFSIYAEAQKKSQMLSAEIEVLERKIVHLENLRKLKEDHLKELTERLVKTGDMEGFKDSKSKSKMPPFNLRGAKESSPNSSTVTGGCDFQSR